MKERIKRGLCLSLCALLLSLSIAGSYSCPTYAATETETTMTKIIDMVLTKTGIVASETILNDVKDDLFELLVEEGDTVIQYHIDNGLELTRDSLVLYWEDQENSTSGIRKYLISALLKSDLFIDTLYALYAPYVENVEELVIAEKDLLEGLGLFKLLTTGVYKIWSEFVELIRALFDNYVTREADYYYIDTVGPKDVNPSWFSTKTAYDNFCSILKDCPYVMFLSPFVCSTGGKLSTGSDNEYSFSAASIGHYTNGLNLVHRGLEGYYYSVYIYDDDWENAEYRTVFDDELTNFKDLTSYELYLKKSETVELKEYTHVNCGLYGTWGCGDTVKIGFCTNDGRQLKVFKDVNTMKMYSVGKQPYYLNQSNDYSTNNDNSVKFDGNYYKDNSSNYSYDIVQNEIDNSTEINEEIVNNIVNDTSSTIINNYYNSESGGNVNTGGNGGTGEGLAGLLASIGSFLDFLLGLIGSVVTLLTTFLNSALTLIGTLGSVFGDFGSLIGELFVFIPKECIDAITAGITLLIFLGLYKAMK